MSQERKGRQAFIRYLILIIIISDCSGIFKDKKEDVERKLGVLGAFASWREIFPKDVLKIDFRDIDGTNAVFEMSGGSINGNTQGSEAQVTAGTADAIGGVVFHGINAAWVARIGLGLFIGSTNMRDAIGATHHINASGVLVWN